MKSVLVIEWVEGRVYSRSAGQQHLSTCHPLSAEHPVTDVVHIVRNPDRKAFSLVRLAVNVDLRIISVQMALESTCPNDALKSVMRRSGPRTEPWASGVATVL